MIWSGLPPELVWGLISRFVGVLYVLAFGALSLELIGIIGERGAVPIAARLARIRSDFPGLRRFFDFPTVFWFRSTDTAIRVVPLLGMTCGLLACYGGELGYAGLVLGWILWLSVEPAGLIFPWDTMLQEAGFLVLFLPVGKALPQLDASALPLPSVAFMFRWFVLRLMLGFAKVKFIGTEKNDAMYLRGFMIWAPLATPLAWWGHHAPRWLLKAALAFMFIGEAIAPVLGFFTGAPRVLSFALMAMLMIGIQATGNWGYFNLGYILLSVCLLDVNASLFDLAREPWASHSSTWPDLAIHAAMGVLFLNSLIYFVILNSWVTRTWVHWPVHPWTWNRRWARALIAYFRALAPFHLTNGYGVFPPNAGPPMRLAPVIEGSNDGQNWKPYGYKYLPILPTSRLPVVAPHHPRFDQALHYTGQCIHDASFLSQTIGDGNPYLAYLRSVWLERSAQRILLDEPLIKSELGSNPFPDAPPKYVRISGYALTPTRPSELKKKGERWRVKRLGTLVRASGRKPWLDPQSVPLPELFHPDFVDYKRRARPLREILRAFAAGCEPDQAVLVESDLRRDEVQRFWGEFVPALNVDRSDWSRVYERGRAIEVQFGQEQLYRFERLLQRFSWLLRSRTEPHFVCGLAPKLEVNYSNFRYEMVLHEIVSDGRDAYLNVVREPALAAERAKRTTDESQLWTLAIVRNDIMLYHHCSFRWTGIGAHGYKYKMQGICEYYPLLAKLTPPEEEFNPVVIKHDDGEFTIEGLYAPPHRAPPHEELTA